METKLPMKISFHQLFAAITACTFVSLTGCAGPAVRLQTEEPLRVDINMRVDVYQHGSSAARPKAGPAQSTASTPESRRRNRMADIQSFKDSRIVGEGRDGLLVVIELPPGDFGDYVQKTVREENADRMAVMKAQAESSKRPLPEVQAARAEDWRVRSFRGEWIEVPAADNQSWQWKQKEG